ncbi:adenosine deaminase [Emticicia sp. BO119]|nr:adenosine deaminase [Emticicia sp. BO119]
MLSVKKTDYARLPKVELHLHLDCSLSYEVVNQIAPEISYTDYQQSFIAPPKCSNLADYIKRAMKSLEIMQTREQLRLVTLDLMQRLKKDNVLYAEIRFAPLLHTEKGLAPDEVVRAVDEAVKEGTALTGVEAGIILCTLRHYTAQQSMQTVKLVEAFRGTNVAGFDIAADEAGYPIDNHVEAFVYAREKQLNVTAHAGEAKGPESVWETLKHLRPSRIGHGVRSIEDPELIQFLKKEDIHLEICPTSNVQTNVIDNIAQHPADKIYKSGVSMSINTDARAISNVTLSDEYQTLERLFGWRKDDFLHCNLEALKHAFIPEEKKIQLRKKLLAGYQE